MSSLYQNNGKKWIKLGENGKSSYEVWLSLGNIGTEKDFLESLRGIPGRNGNDGKDGKSYIAPNIKKEVVKQLEERKPEIVKEVSKDLADRIMPDLVGMPAFRAMGMGLRGDIDRLETEKVTGIGTHKITVSAVEPTNPAVGDIWIDIS
jgi:hypothetical protein